MMSKSILTTLAFITIAAAIILPAHAQDHSTEGTDFYVTFTTNYLDNNDVTCQIRYVVSETCRITTQYGDGTYLDNDSTYQPGVYSRIVDKSKAYINGSAGGGSKKLLRITSNRDIGVYALNMLAETTDATTILPVATWGTDYTVIGNIGHPSYRATFITVIAPTAGTQFTIYDKADNVVATVTSTAENPVYNHVVNQTDLTGYTVESDHNVAVFSSVKCGQLVTVGGCDHNFEQLYPTNTAGKDFFLWNLSPMFNPGGIYGNNNVNANTKDKVVVLALEDDTKVTKKVGATTSTVTLARHGTHAFYLDTAVHKNNSIAPVWLTSDKPVIVNHLLLTSSLPSRH
jgi:hypothetical protein